MSSYSIEYRPKGKHIVTPYLSGQLETIEIQLGYEDSADAALRKWLSYSVIDKDGATIKIKKVRE